MSTVVASAPPTGASMAPGKAAAVLIQTLERRDMLSEAEKQALASVIGEMRFHPEGDVLIRAGRPIEYSTLLLDGLLGRVFYVSNGKRQIVATHVAGDFVDLHSLLLKRLDHDVVALSDVAVAVVPHAKLRQLGEQHPHLMRMLWLLTMIDAATHREWISRLGHSAAVRVAQLLCELQARLDVVGRATPQGFPLALTQSVIADMVDLTPVHINRTLRKLRESGLAVVRDGLVSIPDLAKLRQFAAYDPAYLYLEAVPR
jgi:CRP-like cAMP-binding protein